MSQPLPPEPTAAAPVQATADAHCRNCNASLLGPYCYACGQPVKGLVRPLGNLFGDVLDSVFDLDTRLFRSLPPLFARPGFLSREYFAGRQIRYVTPFRLFFFLCVLAFFVARLSIGDGGRLQLNVGSGSGGISAATTVAEVERLRAAQLAELDAARREMAGTPAAAGLAGIEAGREAVVAAADARIRLLRQAAAKGAPPPPATPLDDTFTFTNDTPWDAETNPAHLPGAPAVVDGWVNRQIARAKHNLARIKADPSQYMEAFIGAIPTALFVLVPVFALMLKLAYAFKRRLYMEHLVVALHSHAFLSLDLLLVFVCMALQRLVAADGMAFDALSWGIGLLLAWAPLYLLLMQKRVYAQGWPMTALKFCVLGTLYMTLLGFAITGAAVASLVWM